MITNKVKSRLIVRVQMSTNEYVFNYIRSSRPKGIFCRFASLYGGLYVRFLQIKGKQQLSPIYSSLL